MATAKRKKDNSTDEGTKKEQKPKRREEANNNNDFRERGQTKALTKGNRQAGTDRDTQDDQQIVKDKREYRRKKERTQTKGHKRKEKRERRKGHKGKENITDTICWWTDLNQNESGTRSEALPSTGSWV